MRYDRALLDEHKSAFIVLICAVFDSRWEMMPMPLDDDSWFLRHSGTPLIASLESQDDNTKREKRSSEVLKRTSLQNPKRTTQQP